MPPFRIAAHCSRPWVIPDGEAGSHYCDDVHARSSQAPRVLGVWFEVRVGHNVVDRFTDQSIVAGMTTLSWKSQLRC